MDAAGGGGYGDPLERDPERVAQDAADGYVSVERAKKDYAAVIDPGTLELDPVATEALRRSLKK